MHLGKTRGAVLKCQLAAWQQGPSGISQGSALGPTLISTVMSGGDTAEEHANDGWQTHRNTVERDLKALHKDTVNVAGDWNTTQEEWGSMKADVTEMKCIFMG